MKFGMRKPSINKRVTSRTSSRLTRNLNASVKPLYGKRGMGWVNSPKKSVYNRVYEKTSFDGVDMFKENNNSGNKERNNYTDYYINDSNDGDIISKEELQEELTGLIESLFGIVPTAIFMATFGYFIITLNFWVTTLIGIILILMGGAIILITVPLLSLLVYLRPILSIISILLLGLIGGIFYNKIIVWLILILFYILSNIIWNYKLNKNKITN